MQLILAQNLEEILPAEIQFNFDELKSELESNLAKYKGKQVTADRIAEAKADCATLNKVWTFIDDCRKRVKKECLKPYETFAAKTDILLALINETRMEQKTQLDAFENARKQARMNAINEFWDSHAQHLRGLVTIQKIWDSKWLNQTCAETKWQTEIIQKIQTITNDIQSLNSVTKEEDERIAVKSAYLESLNMGDSLRKLDELRERKKAIAALESEKAKEKKSAVPQKATEKAREEPASQEPVQDKVLTFTLRFTGPKSKLVALRRFMDENGIQFEKVEC